MKRSEKPSPRIISLSWGSISVEDLGTGKDFKLWPGGGREWDWSETGTRHAPGIQPADIDELIDRGCEAVVLSRGMLLRLGACEETLTRLREHDISVHVAETSQAAEIYNELAGKGIAVGGLFHSSC